MPIDLATKIETASRIYRQQVACVRPLSKGSTHGRRDVDIAVNISSQRRIRSAENKHRHFQPRECPVSPLSLENSLEDCLNEDDTENPRLNLEADFFASDVQRPLSRKKDPSASAAAGLGTFASPLKIQDAFEQRKMRRPIPIESWGPRPPSRHGIPPKTLVRDLNLSLDDDSNFVTPSGKGTPKSPWSGVSLGSAHDASTPVRSQCETRACREWKSKDRCAQEDYAVGRRSRCSGQHDQDREGGRSGTYSGCWASHVPAPALELEGFCLGDGTNSWPSAFNATPHSISVEDIEADFDLGIPSHLYRRDVTTPQLIVTRSSQSRKDRDDSRRTQRNERPYQRGKPITFSTTLDGEFLSLFAT